MKAMRKERHPRVMIGKETLLAPGKAGLHLWGLACADCARKIEKKVGQIPGVKTAEIDFVSQQLTLEAFDQEALPGIVKKAAKIALDVGPDIRVSLMGGTGKQEAEPSRKRRLEQIALCAGVVLFAAALFFNFRQPVAVVLFLASYLLVGGEVILRAIKNISKGQIFDENFLMSVATIGAFAIGEYPEGVAVMLFYQIGEGFQRLAVNRSRKSISALMDIRPDFANLKVGDALHKVAPEEVGIGALIVVKPGEKVPLDGQVVEGRSALDTSALTGESLPRNVEPGSQVLSGSINKNGLLTIAVSKEFGASTVSKILDLVQNAGSKKAPTENFITKFARYYTPFVVFFALLLAVIPPLVIPGAAFGGWIYRALVFLVVSCPCALVISIPLGFFGGIGGASKNGILVKGSNYLEALNHVDTVIFDKTGTLTKGIFKVTKITATDGWSQDDLLFYAAHAEGYSNHPIALSIQKAYGQAIDVQKISDHEEQSGHGIQVKVDGKTVLVGNSKLLDAQDIVHQKITDLGSVVYLAIDGRFAGTILISDEIREDSKQAVKDLKAMGVKRVAMLTGDSKAVGETIAQAVGLDIVCTDLLPHEKVEQLELLEKRKTTKGKLVFIGDGINDAPVLARADVGIAMGGLGSDVAIEAADVVLMTDEPSKLVTAIRIARKTRNIMWQNIFFALGVKTAILILGALGIATMWEAVFGDVGVAIIAICNAMRAMRVGPGR